VQTYGGAEALDLGDFLGQLDQRLDALTIDELRRRIVRYAERLPTREREPFLNVFASGPEEPAAGSVHPGGDPDLLSDIDAFIAQVDSGAYRDDSRWDDEDDDGRSWADDSWAEEMDQLFAGAAEVFLTGDMATAGAAYGRLLDAFFRGLDAAMVSTDVSEATARCLRALYETTPSGGRAAAVYECYERQHYLARQTRTAELAAAHAETVMLRGDSAAGRQFLGLALQASRPSGSIVAAGLTSSGRLEDLAEVPLEELALRPVGPPRWHVDRLPSTGIELLAIAELIP
jgi:hypothetical protein